MLKVKEAIGYLFIYIFNSLIHCYSEINLLFELTIWYSSSPVVKFDYLHHPLLFNNNYNIYFF